MEVTVTAELDLMIRVVRARGLYTGSESRALPLEANSELWIRVGEGEGGGVKLRCSHWFVWLRATAVAPPRTN